MIRDPMRSARVREAVGLGIGVGLSIIMAWAIASGREDLATALGAWAGWELVRVLSVRNGTRPGGGHGD